ncbi:MAG TPA: protein kinase, partial [Gemmatimonadaceae bacterium]|nr:protein kinase [Gemmatimonadaceae bacterium]
MKVLRPELGAVLGVERFLAEIKVTANLQHPNLLPLFDSGEAGGQLFYVMPYVEGESLRVKLEREKQFPVDEAVRIAVAIANALDYAHAHGVIHRDLKPENILMQAGQPVVADFGIALAVSKAGGQRITQTGLSLGTPQYMSPEQATGDRVIDGRSDIYSLGAITYEMLTGEPPHIGSTAQAIIARVLTDKPRSIRTTRSAVPEYVDAAIEHALEKLPADRFTTAHEFAEALQGRGAGTLATTTRTAARPASPSWRARLRDPLVLALAALSIVSVALAAAMSRPAPSGGLTHAVRYVVALNDSLNTQSNFPYPAAISPDGGVIVFTAEVPGKPPTLYALRSDQLVPQPIPGTEGGFQPVFSPDGQWLAFETTGHEKKVRLDGSAPVNISAGGAANGADWTTKNELVLGSEGGHPGLSRVSTSGGELVHLTKPDSAKGEQNHLWPIAFPDGRTIAFVIWYGDLQSARLAFTSVEDGKVTTTDLKAVRALAVVEGRLVYLQSDGAVMAVRVDAAKRRVIGQPVPVHDPVLVIPGNNGNSNIFVSSGGALITAGGESKSELGWYDLKRVFHPLVREERTFSSPRYSPEGKRVSVIIGEAQSTDLWIDDLATSTLTRVTNLGTVTGGEWRPDGKSLLIGSGRGTISVQPAFGGAAPQPFGRVSELAVCGSMSPSGQDVVLSILH